MKKAHRHARRAICASPGLGITNPKWALDGGKHSVCDTRIGMKSPKHFLSAHSCSNVSIHKFF